MLNNFLSKIITKSKKEEFILSPKIPTGYLLNLIIERVFMLFNGMLKLKSAAYIGKNVTIKAKKLITVKGNLSISRNCFIDALSETGIIFGANVSIGKNTTIECTGSLKNIGKGLIIGNNVGLGTHGFFGCAGGVKIGNDTIFGNFVSVHSENHNHDELNKAIRLQGVNRIGITIGNNCWIGSKVTILDGVNIGEGCIIAAGAVLIKGDYKANSIYGGIPAKLLKSRR